ncbi:ATP-binding protein [Colwellia sp. TT2012]|uniref:ATP-binding protein n=1 Tax=Colwellia sp. TT2012 TaxID=1720342 RepID=UPI00070B1C05|nr:ATP-binding protein [Colwellia sp. TT2012]
MPKLTLSLLLVILVAVIGMGGVLDNLFSQYQSQASNQFDELSPYRQLGKSLALTLDKQQEPEQFIANWQQQDELTVTLDQLDDFFLPDSLKQSFYGGKPLVFETDSNISMHFIVPSQQKVLIFNIPPVVKESQNSALQLLLTAVFYLGILLVVLIWLYPLIKQLRKLRQTTKAFGEGHLQQRINVNSTSYIASIENEFNHMAQRIETLVSDNKLLSDAVAHDLRTPLARLRFGIEMLQETDKAETREKYQNHLSRDIDEMERLVSVLLNYARIEQAMMAIEPQSIDLNVLISQCVAAVSDSNKVINWHAQGIAMVNGDANYLSMLINNLLGNAQQYASNEITLKITNTASALQFIISDDGPGIAKEKRDELLKPFMRGEQAHEKPGYGMGLAIVSRIAQLHDAKLVISDSVELGGAEFCVTFHG